MEIAEARAEYARRIKEELAARAARVKMRDFVLFMRPDFLMGWVQEEICATLDRFLDDVLARRAPRLIICMPPRSGKSELISRLFPAYVFGRSPSSGIIACSYAAELSTRFSRDVQRIIDSEPYKRVFPRTSLAQKGRRDFARTADFFEIVGQGGAYRSAGVGGGITGMGCDILCCDDLIKDRAGASSATVRGATYDWYTSTAFTRLSAGGGVVVMGTRWHQDDIIGRLVSQSESGEGEPYHVISYPAIAERDEPHRRRGEALHPERYDLATLEAIRRTVGARDWAALYQQRPIPDGGAVFDLANFRRYTDSTLPPRFEQIIGSWDMTFKDSAGSDFVVGQIWARKGSDLYLLDQVRGQWDFVRTLAVFDALAEKWKTSRWLIEDKANGSAIISVLKREQHGVTPVTPKESKTARAQAVAPMIECGNVHIPAAAPWLAAFEDEVTSFPAGAHDDQVDAMTQALNFLREHRPLAVHPSNLMRLRMR